MSATLAYDQLPGEGFVTAAGRAFDPASHLGRLSSVRRVAAGGQPPGSGFDMMSTS